MTKHCWKFLKIRRYPSHVNKPSIDFYGAFSKNNPKIITPRVIMKFLIDFIISEHWRLYYHLYKNTLTTPKYKGNCKIAH